MTSEVYGFLEEIQSLGRRRNNFKPLSAIASAAYAAALQERALGVELGLIPLIDANDSNPFCYVSRGIARGMVVQFFHDDAPVFCFSSLDSFRLALLRIENSDLHIDEISREKDISHPNQLTLIASFGEYADRNDDEAHFTQCLLLQLLSEVAPELLNRLGGSEDFCVRECVAFYIGEHPSREYLEIAARLASDTNSQVAIAGAAAVKSLARRRMAN